MSYPYTKPTPRFGFRRRWGDPHTGIVGSGPGRPLRRYLTDPEVGIPQLGPGLTALGASPETPFTSGIFNVGPQRGFSRGVFTADPPWAIPRYIASTPDGVSGFGAFGQTTPKCGIPELVDKVIAQFPVLSFSLSGAAKWSAEALGLPTSFSIGPSPEIIKPVVYSLVGQAGESLASLANQGSGYIAGQLASKVSGPITQKILSSDSRIPASAKSAASGIISKLVDETLRNQLYKVGEIIRDCAGVSAVGTIPCSPAGPWCNNPAATVGCFFTGYNYNCEAAAKLAFTPHDFTEITPSPIFELDSSVPGAATKPQIDPRVAAGQIQLYKKPGVAPSAASNLPLILGAAAIAALILTR